MLIRIILALKDTDLEHTLEQEIGVADMEIEGAGRHEDAWSRVVQSCADIIVISTAIFPEPVESGIGVLTALPEGPTVVVLHDIDSTDVQASFIAAGAHSALYSGISQVRLVNALEATIYAKRQHMQLEWSAWRRQQKPKMSDFISGSQTMRIFMDEVKQVAASDSLLLITGETGVGKEHLARVIHSESPRSTGHFVAVNTAAMPEQLLESELFGHKQGAFTGATRSRRGAFEQAHGGTIFLDEIGEMPLHLQTKLLRVLQDYEIRPVGADKPSWVDVRVIAATNRDLEKAVKEGIFRKDLFYRLSVVSLQIPPLRLRREDVPTLARKFITDLKVKIGRDVRHISDTAMAALCAYDWPGNVRELMNVIERSMLLCRTNEIVVEDLPSVFHGAATSTVSAAGQITLPDQWMKLSLRDLLTCISDSAEKLYLEEILRQAEGRIGESARRAGITTRSLYSKMKKHGLQKEHFKPESSQKYRP